MKTRVIFFDIGLTLATAMEVTPRRLWSSRLNLSEKETRRVGRLIMTEQASEPSALARALCKVLPEHSPGEVLQAARTIWDEQADSVREIPGAMDLIVALRKMGYRLGILSNTWFPLFQGFRTVFSPVMHLLEYVVLSFEQGCKKPSREIFCRAVMKTGLPPHSCWMVGDSYELDIRPAMEEGMKTLWVLSSPERETSTLAQLLRGEMRKPDLVAASLEETRVFFEDEEKMP